MSETKKYPAGFGVIDRRYHALHEDLKSNPAFDGPTYQPGVVLAVFTHLMLNAKPSEQRCKLFKTNSNSVACNKLQGLTSLRTLTNTLGFTKHKIEHALNRLVEKGWITLEKCQNIKGAGRRNGARYTINKGYSFDHPFDSSDTCSDDTNNSSYNTVAVDYEIPKQYNTPKFNTVWFDFLQHRSQMPKAKKVTVLAAKRMFSKCIKAGLTVDGAVDEFNKAIEMGWQSVFPATANVKTTNFSKSKISRSSGKGPEALMDIDRKANTAA